MRDGRSLVLVEAGPYPLLREVLEARAEANGVEVELIPGEAWGREVTPWLEIHEGRVRAGLLAEGRVRELGPRDVLWVLAVEDNSSRHEDEYLRAEHEALMKGFLTLCPARVVNRLDLRSPLGTMSPWVLFARLLAGTEAGPLRPPAFHFGRPPEDGRRWGRWPTAGGSLSRLSWTVPEPGPLHLAFVAAGRATLVLVEGETTLVPRVPPELEAALVRFAAACRSEYLELSLVRAGDASGSWVVLDVCARPQSLHRLPASTSEPVLQQLSDLAEWLFAPGGRP